MSATDGRPVAGALPSAAVAAAIEAEKLLLGEFERYAGRCIAIRDHSVCASAASWEDLCAAVQGSTG
jgi:hypothetical protein